MGTQKHFKVLLSRVFDRVDYLQECNTLAGNIYKKKYSTAFKFIGCKKILIKIYLPIYLFCSNLFIASPVDL